MNTIFFYSQWVSDISPLGILCSPPFCCLLFLCDFHPPHPPNVVSWSYNIIIYQPFSAGLYLNTARVERKSALLNCWISDSRRMGCLSWVIRQTRSPPVGRHTESLHQSGPLSLVEECRGLALIGRECCWRQLSYAIKNQLVASKAP